ncbi:hypothetical protein HW561_11360 [Rhodobacteraceae bacterium B1Z28]|uniref:Uncharacterized protein n=1 Tax=Ruegeria haliotis TaxID=2747601 RepID=A0ABX2PQS1_9RHOB|nr:hypothetical protein [Ruegeria haliotis]NVO56388.1 hypothetical protein [Ruegeria haliotis]
MNAISNRASEPHLVERLGLAGHVRLGENRRAGLLISSVNLEQIWPEFVEYVDCSARVRFE